MKKILFATTALVASAGVVAADVSFSGYGRFGAISIDNPAGTADVEGIYTRIRLQVDMTTEADNGLTFGARLRMEDTSVDGAGYGNGGAGSGGFNGARFFARSGGLEIGVGNIFGAIEWMPGVYFNGTQSASIGLSGLGFYDLITSVDAPGSSGWDAYSSTGTGRDGVEVMYSMGDFGGHLSYSNTGGVERTAMYGSYSFNDWTVALGYQDSSVDTEDKVVLTVGGNVGPARVSLGYADNDGIGKFALRGSVDVGAATRVDAYISSQDGGTGGGGEAYGIAASHDLGGGASLEGGFAHDEISDQNRVDLGIRFNF